MLPSSAMPAVSRFPKADIQGLFQPPAHCWMAEELIPAASLGCDSHSGIARWRLGKNPTNIFCWFFRLSWKGQNELVSLWLVWDAVQKHSRKRVFYDFIWRNCGEFGSQNNCFAYGRYLIKQLCTTVWRNGQWFEHYSIWLLYCRELLQLIFAAVNWREKVPAGSSFPCRGFNVLTGGCWCCLSDPAEGLRSRLECLPFLASNRHQDSVFSLESFWLLQVFLSKLQVVSLFNNPLWGFFIWNLWLTFLNHSEVSFAEPGSAELQVWPHCWFVVPAKGTREKQEMWEGMFTLPWLCWAFWHRLWQWGLCGCSANSLLIQRFSSLAAGLKVRQPIPH